KADRITAPAQIVPVTAWSTPPLCSPFSRLCSARFTLYRVPLTRRKKRANLGSALQVMLARKHSLSQARYSRFLCEPVQEEYSLLSTTLIAMCPKKGLFMSVSRQTLCSTGLLFAAALTLSPAWAAPPRKEAAYQQHNLVSDLPHTADQMDANIEPISNTP